MPTKPLGHRAYGSIGHLPGSRLGPGDHHVSPGQARICTEKTRDGRDRVFVQEKLDGSCVAVAKLDGKLVPLIRAGYRAIDSHYEQHHLFHEWAMHHKQAERFAAMLSEGERICGEWIAQAHGTRYDLDIWSDEPFVPFDIMHDHERMPTMLFYSKIIGYFAGPPCYFTDDRCPVPVEKAYAYFAKTNKMQARDPIEGIVYRVERDGKVDFLAKWVRPDKIDGLYLPEQSGKPAVWNWRPEAKAA
jgi:hypothetical protein